MQEDSEKLSAAVRCFRVFGLSMQPLSRPLACMEFAGQVHSAFARSRRLDPSRWFSRPGLTDVAPYLPSTSRLLDASDHAGQAAAAIGAR